MIVCFGISRATGTDKMTSRGPRPDSRTVVPPCPLLTSVASHRVPVAPWSVEATLQQRRGALACNCRTHPPITFPPPEATRQDRAGLGFINRQLREPLDNSPGDESPSAGVRKPGQWSEGFLWFFMLSLPVVAPQTWRCTETDAKRPEEMDRFIAFCRRFPQLLS